MANLSDSDVATAAQALFQAELDNVPITPISETYPSAEVEDAYRISQAVTSLKVAAGRVIKGHKIGLTSKAMRALTNATEPDYGTMFDNWFVMEGSIVPRSTMNRPLVEVELAFVLKRAARRPGRQRGRRDPGHRVRAARDRDRRHAASGPRPEHPDRQHRRCRGVRAGDPRRQPDEVEGHRRAQHRRHAVDQRRHRGERDGACRHGQSDQRCCLVGQQVHEYGVTPEAGHVILSGSFIKAIPFQAGDNVDALFNNGLGEVTFRAR